MSSNDIFLIQGDTLLDIASAIREKASTLGQYTAAQMADAIRAIPTGSGPSDSTLLDHTVTFKDATETIQAVYSVRDGVGNIDAPSGIEVVRWRDLSGNVVQFPITPTKDETFIADISKPDVHILNRDATTWDSILVDHDGVPLTYTYPNTSRKCTQRITDGTPSAINARQYSYLVTNSSYGAKLVSYYSSSGYSTCWATARAIETKGYTRLNIRYYPYYNSGYAANGIYLCSDLTRSGEYLPKNVIASTKLTDKKYTKAYYQNLDSAWTMSRIDDYNSDGWQVASLDISGVNSFYLWWYFCDSSMFVSDIWLSA